MKKKNSLLSAILNLDLYISEFCVALLVVLTITSIITRYVFNKPFAWLEEITSWAFLWSILLGACAAFRRKAHVSIEILVEALPKKLQKVFFVFVFIVTALLLAYLTYQSVIYVGTVIGAHRVTGLLRLPYGVIYGMMPVAAFFMLVNTCYAFAADVKTWLHPEITEEEVN